MIYWSSTEEYLVSKDEKYTYPNFEVDLQVIENSPFLQDLFIA